jgi:hypothetical protein
LTDQVDVHLDIPAHRVATSRQLHLPLKSEVAAVKPRVELQPGDLAEGAWPRWRVVAGSADRARDASDRELAVDLRLARSGEAGRR